MNEDTTHRHLIRLGKDDFTKQWATLNCHVPAHYCKELLTFDKFCTENNWTFKEGLIFITESFHEERITKARAELEEINNFKDRYYEEKEE